MSAVSSSFKRTGNNPRRFYKPWQLNDRIWKHCKNQARRLVSKICVQFDARKKKKIKLCSASRMTCRAWFYRTDPQNWRTIRKTFGLFEKNFSKTNELKKALKYISDRKVSGLFLRNEHYGQFIPWRLRFQAWLNLYISMSPWVPVLCIDDFEPTCCCCSRLVFWRITCSRRGSGWFSRGWVKTLSLTLRYKYIWCYLNFTQNYKDLVLKVLPIHKIEFKSTKTGLTCTCNSNKNSEVGRTLAVCRSASIISSMTAVHFV